MPKSQQHIQKPVVQTALALLALSTALSICLAFAWIGRQTSYPWHPSPVHQQHFQLFKESSQRGVIPPFWDAQVNQGRGSPSLLLPPPLPYLAWTAARSYEMACLLAFTIAVLGALTLAASHSLACGTITAFFYGIFLLATLPRGATANADVLGLLCTFSMFPWFIRSAVASLKNDRIHHLGGCILTTTGLVLAGGIPAAVAGGCILISLFIYSVATRRRSIAPIVALIGTAATTLFYWLPIIFEAQPAKLLLPVEEWNRWGLSFWDIRDFAHRSSLFPSLLLAAGILIGGYSFMKCLARNPMNRRLSLILGLSLLTGVGSFWISRTELSFLGNLNAAALGLAISFMISEGLQAIYGGLRGRSSSLEAKPFLPKPLTWAIMATWSITLLTLGASFLAHAPPDQVSAIEKNLIEKSPPPAEQTKGRSDLHCSWTSPVGFHCNTFVVHRSDFRFLMSEYPGWRLIVDGKPHQPNRDLITGWPQINLQPGPHSMDWILSDSPIRAAAKWISAMALLLTCFALMGESLLSLRLRAPTD